MQEISGYYFDQVRFNTSPTVAQLTFLERACYRELLDLAWQEDGLDPDPRKAHVHVLSFLKYEDPAGEALLGFSEDDWTAFLDKIFPVGEDGRRRNPKQEEERTRLEAKRKAQSERGKKGARKRHGNEEYVEDSSPTSMQPPCKRHSDPMLEPSQSESESYSESDSTKKKETLVDSTSAPPKGGTPKSELREQVKSAFLEARQDYYWQKNGKKARAPNLDGPELSKLIDKALNRHGVEQCMAAARGIFLSPWHRGENPNGTEYLTLNLALRIDRKGNRVEQFSELWEQSRPRAPAPRDVQRERFKARVRKLAVEAAGGLEAWERLPSREREKLIDEAIKRLGKEDDDVGT